VRAARSLRTRLLAGVLAAVATAWIAVSVAAYLRARHELEELLDAHLAQSAALLVAQLPAGEDELDLEHAPELHRYARKVAFQIWEDGRKLRLHSLSAPQERLSPVDRGFSDSTVSGVRWRVFSAWVAGRKALVQVGERSAAREALSRQIALHLLLPLALGLPLLGVALTLAVGRALRPLRALADVVAARDPLRLEPIGAAGVPREVLPLVERLNALFARIAASIEKERAFTADAAHELRTPLAAIRAQAQVAYESADGGERSRALQQVMAGCDRAARLSEQLLTLARLEDAASRKGFEACDLREVARSVLAERAQDAHSRGVALELHAEAPARVQGDAALLHVLLRNLVDNAVRYGAEGGVVRVEAGASARGVVLRVIDRGPGIPAGERGRVLDRFHRLPGSGEPGAGLGLSIVSRIASLHGATLELREGPQGRGLEVSLAFPAAPGAGSSWHAACR
jgi:two-component system sensor histidine kinase QseC